MADLEAIAMHINNVNQYLSKEGYEVDFASGACSQKKANVKKITPPEKQSKPKLGGSESGRYPEDKYNSKISATAGSPKAEATPDEPVTGKKGNSKIIKVKSSSKGNITHSPENPAVDGDYLPELSSTDKKMDAKKRAKTVLDEGEGATLKAHGSTSTRKPVKNNH